MSNQPIYSMGRLARVQTVLERAHEARPDEMSIAIPEIEEERAEFKLTLEVFLKEVGLLGPDLGVDRYFAILITDPAYDGGTLREDQYARLTPQSELDLDSRIIVMPFMRGG